MSQVAICVCTYKRPAQLGHLFDSLLAVSRPPRTAFVIVDNDGQDQEVARRVDAFRQIWGGPIEYVIEPKPGISAARNAAFAAARALGVELVAMLDDDEWASPQWLTGLLETRQRTGATVVGGPVFPRFPSGSNVPEKYAGLWTSKKDRLHGETFISNTSNFLVELSAIDGLGDKLFDEEFGLTGGGDVVFFRKLFFAGCKMAWCDDAVLYDDIPMHRANFTWLRRRWYRYGNAAVRWEHRVRDPRGIPPALRTALMSLRLLVLPLIRPGVLADPVLWLLEYERVRGRLASHLGVVFAEYERPRTAERAAA